MRNFRRDDYQTLCEWMAKRGRQGPEFIFLPPIGLIEDNVACGFLIQCDNKCGILDFFITNPNIPRAERIETIDKIAESLIFIAGLNGLSLLKCDTMAESIKEMAKRHGFSGDGLYSAFSRRI